MKLRLRVALEDWFDFLVAGGILAALLLLSRVGGTVGHWTDRQLFHILAAPGLGLFTRRALFSANRRLGGKIDFLLGSEWMTVLLLIPVVWFLEPLDALQDGPAKSYLDLAAWALGFSAWVLASRKEFWDKLDHFRLRGPGVKERLP